MKLYSATFLGLLAVPSLASPAADVDSVSDRIAEKTGIRFSVFESLLRRRVTSTDTPFGFKVKSVEPASRAERADVRPGDVLLRFDGMPIRTLTDLVLWIDDLEDGERAWIEVARRRDDIGLLSRHPWKTIQVHLRVGRPDLREETGMTIDFLGSYTLRRHGRMTNGLKVDHVDPGSPAAAAGLRPGDVIVTWDDRSVRALDEWERWLAENPGGAVHVTFFRRKAFKFTSDPWLIGETDLTLPD